MGGSSFGKPCPTHWSSHPPIALLQLTFLMMLTGGLASLGLHSPAWRCSESQPRVVHTVFVAPAFVVAHGSVAHTVGAFFSVSPGVSELLKRWACTGRATEGALGTVCPGKDHLDKPAPYTCHMTPSALSPKATSLLPGLQPQPHRAMDSPQSQTVSLATLVSAAAASLSASSAPATCILGQL